MTQFSRMMMTAMTGVMIFAQAPLAHAGPGPTTGGIIGAIIGSRIAKKGHRSDGAVAGAIVGAVIGDQIDKSKKHEREENCRLYGECGDVAPPPPPAYQQSLNCEVRHRSGRVILVNYSSGIEIGEYQSLERCEYAVQYSRYNEVCSDTYPSYKLNAYNGSYSRGQYRDLGACVNSRY